MARVPFKEIQGKTVVSEGGRMFGKVLDATADVSTGELINMIVEPTKYITAHFEDLVKDKQGRILLPFSAVSAVGDFVLVNEADVL
ncbi:TPA: PRC-barrel domain-containing protein [archaeon]|uniref:PRC-barrel domain-containing protein n=1 Tax=Candidatus Naiadarchaeum limnaeum TaxID=2756139 RepID=A0A832V0X7_9ARCH|nr:PRC-barrel domain-containing protein [Candidatus Naiadarchaeales archaeon SRR2090153.bin1042]HIK00208.1 PRC-barrel domain-containing protein [Candidatus Naiadarchaeum limnaeum]